MHATFLRTQASQLQTQPEHEQALLVSYECSYALHIGGLLPGIPVAQAVPVAIPFVKPVLQGSSPSEES